MTLRFSELKIEAPKPAFQGEKLSMNQILNLEIKVHKYEVGPSNFEGKRLTIQFELDGKLHIVFTASTVLLQTLERIPEDSFPFMTRIVRIDKRFQFT